MLVLTRKVGEAVQIGPDIRIVLVEIDRNRVRIGIEAPRGVPVFREELLPLDPDCPPPAAAPAPGH